MPFPYILITVALQAKFRRSGRGQPDTSDIFRDPHFMTTEAPLLRGRVNESSLDLVFMTRRAYRCSGIGTQGGMLPSHRRN